MPAYRIAELVGGCTHRGAGVVWRNPPIFAHVHAREAPRIRSFKACHLDAPWQDDPLRSGARFALSIAWLRIRRCAISRTNDAPRPGTKIDRHEGQRREHEQRRYIEQSPHGA